jgi:hypothetical protein
MNPDSIHDVADKCRVSEEILGKYGIRIDPKKHALHELEELDRRLHWADRCRKEFDFRANWRENDSDTLRKVFWELNSEWMSYD